jgi:hypothetical protein
VSQCCVSIDGHACCLLPHSDFYKLAELSLNEMDIYIEEQFLLKMVNFFSLNISNWGKTEQTVEEVTTTYA